MKRCFAAGIPQATLVQHLSFHYGQCLLMLHIGYRDGNDLDAAMALGIYIQESARRWAQQRVMAKRQAVRAKNLEEVSNG